MKWEKILADAVQNGTIRELYLSKVPTLKTVENWNNIKPIGLIDHKTKHAHYKGALVKYNENLYFISDQKINALSQWINWKFPTTIKVQGESEKQTDKK